MFKQSKSVDNQESYYNWQKLLSFCLKSLVMVLAGSSGLSASPFKDDPSTALMEHPMNLSNVYPVTIPYSSDINAKWDQPNFIELKLTEEDLAFFRELETNPLFKGRSLKDLGIPTFNYEGITQLELIEDCNNDGHCDHLTKLTYMVRDVNGDGINDSLICCSDQTGDIIADKSALVSEPDKNEIPLSSAELVGRCWQQRKREEETQKRLRSPVEDNGIRLT